MLNFLSIALFTGQPTNVDDYIASLMEIHVTITVTNYFTSLKLYIFVSRHGLTAASLQNNVFCVEWNIKLDLLNLTARDHTFITRNCRLNACWSLRMLL